MELAEFLDKLKSSNKKWEFTSDNEIRCEQNNCPIIAIAYDELETKYKNDDYNIAGDELGLSSYNMGAIVSAADSLPCKADCKADACEEERHMRALLENATNLGMVPWKSR